MANIHWIIEKAREFQKNIYLALLVGTKTSTATMENSVEIP